MASYWKSPYKEVTNTNVKDSMHCDPPLTPSGLRTFSSASNTGKLSACVSPQDWFDWSISNGRNSARNHSLIRRSRSEIRGILKVPTNGDADMPQSGRLSQNSLSYASTFDESTQGQKEKKKVTFNGDVLVKENHDQLPRFHSDRSISAHLSRIQNAQPLDELARQNLKKLLGYIPHSSTLPSVSGKSIMPKREVAQPFSETCRHGLDLRCSHCANECDTNHGINDPKAEEANILESRPHYLESTQDVMLLNLESTKDSKLEPFHPEAIHQVGLSDPFDSVDFKLSSKTNMDVTKVRSHHWTKSFMKPGEKWKSSRYVGGRYPFSAGTLHKHALPLGQTKNPISPQLTQLSKNLLKLHISGDGKIDSGERDWNDTKKHIVHRHRKRVGSAQSDGSGHSRGGHRGRKILTKGKQNNLTRATSSAQLRVKYGTPALESQEDRKFHLLDKTSQILSWLKDVRLKENFQPRNARLYALEPQELQ